MIDQPDHGVRELGNLRLKLRGDLIFTPQLSSAQPYYMIEDSLNSRFFRLGHCEYTFVSLLDGETTLHAALSRLSSVMPDHQLTEVEAAGLCRWLVSMDLARPAGQVQSARLAAAAESIERRKALANWNPLSFRLPLGRPDRVFAAAAQALGWLYSPLAAVGWLVLVGAGAYRVFADWDRFAASSQGVFAPDNWLWLAGCWVALKALHETSHGIVCKRYGGPVRETGILFILFAPLAYVDVTSSWRFRSRWKRVHVAAAGMYIELLLAAAAAIVWSHSGPGWLSNLCFNLILMASLTTLLFNANPLMKFDGYYMLSDALSMPNLYVNGQASVRAWARQWLLGLPTPRPAWPAGQRRLTQMYGWASLVWRVVVCASLTVTAATLFHGAGVVLAAAAVVLWLGLPALQLLRFLIFGAGGEQPRRVRFALLAGAAAAIGTGIFGYVPWPGARKAPAIIEYSPHTVVRAASAGFVKELHVVSGEEVEAGQLLAALENRQLEADVAILKLQIQQSEVRAWQHEQKGELAAQQAETQQRVRLQSQLHEKQSQVEQLAVRAPCAGKVLRRDLANLQGAYLEEGEELVSIGGNSRKEVRLSIAQDDLDEFTHRVGELVRLDAPGHALRRCRLDKVIPRASVTLAHPALAAVNGGPLPVKPVARREREAADSHELLTPRFNAVVRLSEADSQAFHAGQRVQVTCQTANESIGQHLRRGLARWVQRRWTH